MNFLLKQILILYLNNKYYYLNQYKLVIIDEINSPINNYSSEFINCQFGNTPVDFKHSDKI